MTKKGPSTSTSTRKPSSKGVSDNTNTNPWPKVNAAVVNVIAAAAAVNAANVAAANAARTKSRNAVNAVNAVNAAAANAARTKSRNAVNGNARTKSNNEKDCRKGVYQNWRTKCDADDGCKNSVREKCGIYGVGSDDWPITKYHFDKSEKSAMRAKSFDVMKGQRCLSDSMWADQTFVESLKKDCNTRNSFIDLVNKRRNEHASSNGALRNVQYNNNGHAV